MSKDISKRILKKTWTLFTKRIPDTASEGIAKEISKKKKCAETIQKLVG